MTPRATLLRFALPAGIALMLLLTLQTVTRSSSESMTSYGFPLAWHAPSAHISARLLNGLTPATKPPWPWKTAGSLGQQPIFATRQTPDRGFDDARPVCESHRRRLCR